MWLVGVVGWGDWLGWLVIWAVRPGWKEIYLGRKA